MKLAASLFIALALAPGVARAQPTEQSVSPAIENGATVQLEYTLKDDTGAVLDSNKGGSPITFTQGRQQLVPGLEKALNGMHPGEEKQVTVKPEDGYGDVNPTAQTEVPKAMLPPDSLAVGSQLVARSRGGESMLVRIKEIKESTVIIDLNHPLAGKTLFFDVKITGVEPPKK